MIETKKKTLLELDLKGFTELSKIIEETTSTASLFTLKDRIGELIGKGLEVVRINRRDAVMSDTGDGGILVFDTPSQAHIAAVAIHHACREYNQTKTIAIAKLWFRIGIATGEFATRARDAAPEMVGGVIARAVRLETAGSIGQVLIDPATFEGLLDDEKPLYGDEETVTDKNGEIYQVRRYVVIEGMGATYGTAPLASAPVVPDRTSSPAPPDADRIDNTRLAILDYLHRNQFTDVPGLAFAPNHLPERICNIFSSEKSPTRVQIADDCTFQILQFAKDYVRALESLPVSPPTLTNKRKAALRKRFINAMQEAILLSARWQRTAEIVHQVAFGDDHSHELEVMSWLSVSVLMREKIADHVQVNPEKRASDPLEDKHAPSFGEVELGAMKRGDLARAQDEAFRMVERALWPLEAVTSGSPTRQKTEELQGDARLQKREGNPLLLVLDKKSGGVSPELLKWLNNDFHVGYVIITTSNGEFELREGEWKATLVKLCHILQPFAQ